MVGKIMIAAALAGSALLSGCSAMGGAYRWTVGEPGFEVRGLAVGQDDGYWREAAIRRAPPGCRVAAVEIDGLRGRASYDCF